LNVIKKESLSRNKSNKSKEIFTTKGENVVMCFYCTENGHYQSQCPKLKEIIDKNKEIIFNSRLLNF